MGFLSVWLQQAKNLRFHYRVLSWGGWIKSICIRTISVRPVLIMSSCLLQGFLTRPIRSVFPTKMIYLFLLSPMHATCPTHPTLHNSHNAFLSRRRLCCTISSPLSPEPPVAASCGHCPLQNDALPLSWQPPSLYHKYFFLDLRFSGRLLWRSGLLISEMWCYGLW